MDKVKNLLIRALLYLPAALYGMLLLVVLRIGVVVFGKIGAALGVGTFLMLGIIVLSFVLVVAVAFVVYALVFSVRYARGKIS